MELESNGFETGKKCGGRNSRKQKVTENFQTRSWKVSGKYLESS